MVEELIDPPPESQEQVIISDYNNLVGQYPDSSGTPVKSVDEIDDEKYKELTLNDINAKRLAFENSFGLKVEPFTSLEDYQERVPLIVETAKKVYLDANSTKSIGDFENFLAKSLSTQSGSVPPPPQQQPTEKPFNFNEALGSIPPVGGYGSDVPRETSGKVLEYKLGEAKRKELADAKQLQANAFRLRQTNQLPDDQVKVLNALQNNAYQGFVPTDNKNIGLSVFNKPSDEELDALNTRAGNIAEGNLLEAQQIGSQLKQIDKDIQENYLDRNIAPPAELIQQSQQLHSQWRDRIDKANLFSIASNKGMVENYNRQVEKGNLMGDFAVSAVAGLNNLGKSVINSLATLQPSDVLKFSGVDNPLQNDKFDKMFGYDKDKAKKWIQDFNTNNAKGFDHVMYDVMKLSTPEHREAQGKIMSAVSGIIELAPPMAIAMMSGNPYISYSVWAANSYGSRIEQMTKDPRWENASLDEIKMAALPASLAEAAVMEVGLKNVKQATGIGKGGLDQTTKIYNALRNATESIVPNSGLNGLQKSIIDGATRMTTGAITASGTGATVSMVDDIGKNLYNIAMGDASGLKTEKQEDGSYNIIDNSGKIVANEPTEERANKWKYRFEPVTPYQIVENGVNSAKDWALMGMIMSAPMTAHAILKGAKVDSRDFAFTKSLVEDGSRVNTMYASIKNDLATGKIDKAEAQDRITALKEFKNIADKIPSDLTPQNQRKAFDLLNNIKKLEAQKVGKAEGLTGSIDKQIAENKTKLQEIGDAPQDRSKDDYSGEESFWAHTIREFDNGVNYGMKFENTSSDATPKNENNATGINTKSDADIDKRISEIEYLLSSNNASMQERGMPNLVRESIPQLQQELADLKGKQKISTETNKAKFENTNKVSLESKINELEKARAEEIKTLEDSPNSIGANGDYQLADLAVDGGWITTKSINEKYDAKINDLKSESKPNDNANAEITNTESTSIDGQNKVQGQPEANIETVSNSTEAKNAEVVGEVKKEPKSLIQLESENKSTLPKIPTKNVFNNNVEVLPRDVVSKADKYMEEGESSKLPLEKIDVSKIVPTQKNLTVDNLKNTESVKSSKEDITLFKEGDKYYVLDGHHRIANEILKGNGEIEGRVFDNTKSEKSIEQPIADPTKEPIPFIQEVTGNKKAVTLSGNSEAKRQKLIANRVEKTTLSGAQKSESELAQKVKKFNDMTPSERVKNFRLLNEIKADANGRFKVINNGSKDKVEVKAKTKKGTYRNIQILTSDAGRRSIAPNGKALHERPQEFQQEFVKLMDLGIPFEFRNADGNSKFEPSQEASAIADIYDGIPSEQAEIVLNTVQKAIETNQIEFGDQKQGFGVKSLKEAIDEIAIEQNAEDYKALSVENLEKYYKENAELQEQFEQIIQQEYENIANGVDETTATELNGESETADAKSDSKELPNEKADEKSQSQEGLEPPKPPASKSTESGDASDDFKKLVHKNIESDVVSNTLSNVERETGRELTKEEKEYNEIKLKDALDHGTNVVERAKEEFGKDYVSKLLDFLDNNQTTLSTDKKSLIQIALELDLGRQIEAKPDNVLTLEKQLKFVEKKSMDEQRSAARAIGYGRLRQIARVGYDISKITDNFFSSKELESKRTVEKAIQADADTINKEAEKLEQDRTDNLESDDNKSLVDKHEALKKQMSDLQNKIKADENLRSAKEEADRKKFEDDTIKRLKAEVAKEKGSTKPAVRTKEVIKAELDKARAQLRIDLAQLSSGGLQAIGSFVEVVKLAAELNIKNASAFLKEFRDDLKGYSDKEIMDAFNVVNGKNEFEKLTTKAVDLASGELHTGMKSTIDKMLKAVVESNPEITHVEAVDKIYEALKKDLPDIDRSEVRDLVSGYGKYKLLSKEQIPVAIREIKTLNRLDAGLDAVNVKNELPLRTGMERHEKTEAARTKEAEILRIIKEKGLTPDLSESDIAKQYKSAEATYQKRIENAITDIEKEIETGERKAKANPKEYNSERSKQLKADLERLKEIRDAKFSEPKKTVGELKIEAIRNKIDEINQRVVTTKETKGVDISDADLKTIKDLQEELYQAKQEAGLIKGKDFKSAEEKRLESEANKLENLKSKLDDLLAGKVRDKKISEPDSQEVKGLKAQIKAIEFPPKTEAEKQLAKEDTKEKATQKAIDDITAEIELLKKGETIDGEPTVRTKDGKQIFDIKTKQTDKVTNDRIKELEALKENLKDEKSNLIPAEIKKQAIILKERTNRKRRLEALKAQIKDKNYAKPKAEPIAKPYDMEVESINAEIKSIEEKIGKENRLIKDALIEAGFGMETTVTKNLKDANGNYVLDADGKKVKEKTKIQILDWKKLPGEEGSIEKMEENVSEVLKKRGFSESEITDIQDGLKEEYNNLRESVILSSLNELNKRNKITLTPTQKSAAKKLAEDYNYGLFEKDPSKYEILLTKALGIDKLNPERFERARELGKAMSVMYSTKLNGRKLNDLELKTAIQSVEEATRILLHDEYQQHGSTALKIANITRTYMDLSQRMILNNLKQVVDNTTSGLFQSKMTQIEKMFNGNTTKELRQQSRELANAVFKDMVLAGGVSYGDVNSTFVNRGSLDAYISKMSDNQIYHAITSTLIGKTALDAADSKYKAKLTEFQFTHNLIKILTEKRLINGELVDGMSKEDALHYVSEKLTGQSFEDAKKTAREIISKVNSGSDKKILHDSESFVIRLANDIVKSSLVNGNIITADQVTMAYNSAYKSAGRNLGHVANNWFSKGVQGISAEMEKKINDASKEKEYKKAALLTMQSIVFRNIINPFVGGGTNWAVLKLEKNGLGLFSGLYNEGRSKLDLSTESGLRSAKKALYEEARDADAKTRSIIGGLTAVTLSALFYGVTTTDEYRKWRNKNMWAARYLDIFTPEEVLAMIAVENNELDYYMKSLLNKNDAYDKGKKVLTGVSNLVKSSKEDGTQKSITLKEKAMGKIGEAVGGILNAPVPWRAIRDGQNIWLGATGQEPYKISNKPTTSFFEGAFKAGLVDYIRNNPTNKNNVDEPTLLSPSQVKNSPSIKYFTNKGIELPSISLDKVPVKDIPTKTDKFVSDYSLPLQKLYTSTHLRIFEKNLQKVINRGYVYKQEGYSGNISNQYTKDGVKRNKVLLSKLTDKELEEVWSNAMTSAMGLAKKKVFTRSAQLSDKKK